MNRVHLSALLLALLLPACRTPIVASAVSAPGASGTPERPNILLFLVDDLGWQDLSVPLHDEKTTFNRRYRTPHLEALAARGMRFTNAYASAPVCTPTRTSIMTGESPGQSHITWWVLHADRDNSKKHRSLEPPAWRMNGLDEEDVTLPRLLADGGYRTIHVGKAHFGAHGTFGADPKDLGFQVNVAGHGSGGPASYRAQHHFTLAGRQGKEPHASASVWDIPGLEAYHGSDLYLTEALAIEASRELRRAAAEDRPFFLNFAPYAVHAPIMANERYLEHYPHLDPREAAYATMIETYDAALGVLMDTLEDLGALDDTLIVFSSDNGGLSAHARGGVPHTHNAPLNSGKGSAMEGGTRVPTIIAWPGVTPADSRCDVPVISHDLFPTLLAAAGQRIPDRHVASVEGSDLTALLAGDTEAFDADRALFWHQPHQWGATGPGIEPFSSVRYGDEKLIYFHADRRFELYDLAADLGETTNLAAQRPERVGALAKRLSAWIEQRGVQLSIDRQSGLVVELPEKALERAARSVATIVPAASTESRAAAAGWLGGGAWIDQHQEIVRSMRELRPRVVLLGDSITQSFGGPGRNVGKPGQKAFEQLFGDTVALSAGISGDRTQHLLWRIDHGLFDEHVPEVVVVMIGTNNLPHDEAGEITRGIEAVLARLAAIEPAPEVILLGVPPRGEKPDHPHRVKGQAINAALLRAAGADSHRYLDPATVLLGEDGVADRERMIGDFVHFKGAGYEALAGLLKPEIEAILAGRTP